MRLQGSVSMDTDVWYASLSAVGLFQYKICAVTVSFFKFV